MRSYLFAAACMIALAGPAFGQHGAAPAHSESVASKTARDPYQPYAFLVGEWRSNAGPSTLRQKIGWGPHRAYMTYSTYMQQAGGEERLHFDGIMVWNGASKSLDYLFAVEPGSGIQEKGSVRAEADGSIVREVEFTGPDGKTAQFRQTFRKIDADRAITSLMALRNGKWEPNFPGSDRIEMVRRRD
jgi:hypothetical protein